jgi:hypothetical protein
MNDREIPEIDDDRTVESEQTMGQKPPARPEGVESSADWW